jgi:hypothetical protein
MSKLTPLASSQDKKVTPFKCTRKHVDDSEDEGIEEDDNEKTNDDLKSVSNSDGGTDGGKTKKSSKKTTEKAASKPTTAPNPVIPVILEKDYNTRHEFLIAKGKEYMKKVELELYRQHRSRV